MFGKTKNATELSNEEDWIRQMFAGTIHNIGNVVTVARLTVSDLEESSEAESAAILNYLLDELLPVIEQHAAAGTVADFIEHDPDGREYLGSIRKLLEHQRTISREQRRTVEALGQKLNHISEVIVLQQRLLAGLGTQEEVSLESLINNAIKMMTESATRHGVKIHCDFGETQPLLLDPSLMTQVFINLLKNAIEALDRVHADGEITIRTRTVGEGAGRRVVCEVADNGPGIAPEIRDHIFDFGFSTKSSGRQGNGVGLHFCQRTLERFGGAISVESQPGHGAIFRLALNCQN